MILFFIQQMIQKSFASSFWEEKTSSFWVEKIIPELKGDLAPLDKSIEGYILYILGFLYFIAILYGIYWGFFILTAASDDEKVAKGKKVILQAILWLIVIYFAGAIARFIIWENWILYKN